MATADDAHWSGQPARELGDGADEGGGAPGRAEAAPLALSVSRPTTGLCVVEVGGDLDALTVPFLNDCVRDQLAAGPVQLVIDLERVSFLGSAGISALVEYSRWLDEAVPGSKLHLSGTARRLVHRPLELVGLLPLFAVHRTLDQALAQLRADPV
ncbi:MAG TPA: STAS domain-containing protein [Pseudonocardia sp.]|nr:STAS domain-containing protein [Pseudonocardia sp.]